MLRSVCLNTTKCYDIKEERLRTLKHCLDIIQNVHDVLEDVRDEEQDTFVNMTEGQQDSERGDF